jgi:S1-C subfamily serine protease
MNMQLIYNSVVRIISNNQDNDYYNPSNVITEEPSIGTGFFIDKNIIITCSHVVELAETIYFTIPTLSSNKYKAKIQGICQTLDIAILQSIEYDSPSFLNITNSDNANLQDPIVVVGFPLGRDKIKVTKGIISGSQDGYLQIDSAINSGNSGGPLINSEQKVIGIISSKVINADNIGYAIPINLLSIFKSNNTSKVYNSCNLLAKFSNTSTYRIKQLNELNTDKSNPIVSGFTISNMSKSSPLKNIGIELFDIIIEIDNKMISNFGEITIGQDQKIDQTQIMASKMDLIDYVEKLIPSYSYQIKFFSIKNKKIINTSIIFPIENNIGVKKIIPKFDQFASFNLAGLILTPLTINAIESQNKISLRLRKYAYYTERFEPKVFVANIEPHSPFVISENINTGDIIIKINGTKIYTIDDIKEILKNISDEYITIETKNDKIDIIDIQTLNEYNKK